MNNPNNSIIAAFYSLFLLGKASKETREKTRSASWIRAGFYGLLTWIVWVFFCKTNQVATLSNIIEIEPWRTCYYENDSCSDFIHDISILTNFSGDGNYKNRNNDFNRGAFKGNAEKGGVFFQLAALTEDLSQLRWKQVENDNVFKEMNFNPEVQHVYHGSISVNQLPSLLPITPYFKWKDKKWNKNKSSDETLKELTVLNKTFAGCLRDEKVEWINTSFGSKRSYDLIGDGTVIEMIICDYIPDSIYRKHPMIVMPGFCRSKYINKLNIFSAADISQITLCIMVVSPLPVNEINFSSDIPIEISTHMDSISIWSSMEFSITGGELLKNISDGRYVPIHIKLPTLANLQFVRSFVLTTLLTVLASLFLINIYYCLRRAALRYRHKSLITEKQQKQINQRRMIIFQRTLFCLLFAVVSYWSYMLLYNKPILYQYKEVLSTDRIYFVLIAIIIILFFAFLFFLRWAHTPMSPKPIKKDDSDDETPPTFFLHERTEEEEMDKLFAGLPEDDMIAIEEAEAQKKTAEESEIISTEA